MEQITKEKLKDQLNALDLKYKADRQQVLKEYALSNNTLKVGDVVTDHIGIIKIESIGVYIHFEDSECTYKGVELRKDGTPKKGNQIRTVYQSNIIK